MARTKVRREPAKAKPAAKPAIVVQPEVKTKSVAKAAKPLDKPKAKRVTVATADGDRSPTPPSPSPTPAPVHLDKTFVLRLVLAKLDMSKACDWYDLAQRMGVKEVDETQVKGRKTKKNVGSVWTGTELHEIFHKVVLPALKSGRALWADDAVASDLFLPAPIQAAPSPALAVDSIISESDSGVEKTSPLPTEDIEDEDLMEEGSEAGDHGDADDEEKDGAETSLAEEEGGSDSEDQIGEGEDEGKKVEETEECREPSMETVVEEPKEEKKERQKRTTKPAVDRKPLPKLATTYKSAKTSPALPPSLGHRQTSDDSKKRIRPAYSDDDDDETIQNQTPVAKKAKTAVTPSDTQMSRRGRTIKKAIKYGEESGSE